MRKKIREWAESPRALVAGLSLGYVAVALALLPHFRYSINPDGISYISIARRYLAGDWHGAFNGYCNARPDLDYRTVSCPACEQACREACWIAQSVLLGSAADMDDIVAAAAKVQRLHGGLSGLATASA